MKYCRQIFHEINFEPNSISPCCNLQGIQIPVMPYHGGEIDLKEYGRLMSNALAAMQEQKDICKGCNQLGEVERFPEYNGKFDAVSINMHRFLCNCKCVYCNLWKKPKHEIYDILPALKSLQEQGALSGTASFSWGGGEPGIYPAFEHSANWILNNNYFQYIHTNAIKYSPAIAAVLNANKGRINVSLDSGSAAIYKNVKGVDCFDKVIENISSYARSNPAYIELKYIIFDVNNNIGEIRKFIDFVKDTGISNIQFSFDFRDQNLNKISEKSYIAAAYMFILSAQENIRLNPFFVPDADLEKINEYVKKLLN